MMEQFLDGELYGKLVCALLHNIDVCNSCKKCGPDAPECRMNLIRELAKATGNELPWNELEARDSEV